MKIVYIANIRIPTEKAHGIQVMKMCEAFASHGEVELIIPKRKSKQLQGADPFLYYGVEKKFMITRLKTIDPYWFMKLPQGIYIKFQILFFVCNLFIYLLLKRKKEEFIFYTRDEYLLPVLQGFSKKVVWEAHNIPRNKNYYVKYWKTCDTIIVLTSYIKRELIGMGVDEKKIFVAPDGVDLKLFAKNETKDECRKKLGLPLDKKIILYTGHLYKWKGAQTLALACQYLGENFLCVFIGGADRDIEDFKLKNQKNNKIVIVGHKPHEMMPMYLSAADILALPNSAKERISQYYTSPLKFFEYLASKKPIMASDIPSLHEIGDKFLAVYYCKPDDPEDLARKIKDIDTQKTYSRNLDAYTWEARSKNIITFIHNG